MADQTVAALQIQLNRFASAVGFAQLAIDGVVGQNTGSAVLQSLAFVANQDPNEADTAAGLTAALVNDNGSVNTSQIAKSATGLAIFLGQEGDSLRLQAAQIVASGGGGATPILNPAGGLPSANMATNLLATIKGLPTWAKVAGGIAFGMLGIFAYKKVQEGKHA